MSDESKATKLALEQSLLSPDGFNFKTLQSAIFSLQLGECAPFKAYAARVWESAGTHLFLPIEVFKTHDTNHSQPVETVFKSSGTTGTVRSVHRIHNLSLYNRLAANHFEYRFGSLRQWIVLGLLPHYEQSGQSSLVHMVNHFAYESHHENSALLGLDLRMARDAIQHALKLDRPVMLIGVSYALLDLAAFGAINSDKLHLMETGGMKGRGVELSRPTLHARLKQAFPSSAIYSEYGMTELLSQAYSTDGKWFMPAPTLRCAATDPADPFNPLPPHQRGLLAFTDLANVHSCSFIQTRDVGCVRPDGAFTVEGRADHSDLRGCNLLAVSQR